MSDNSIKIIYCDPSAEPAPQDLLSDKSEIVNPLKMYGYIVTLGDHSDPEVFVFLLTESYSKKTYYKLFLRVWPLS